MTKARAQAIWERDDGLCWLCEKPVAWGAGMEIEHPIALVNGGSDDDLGLHPVHASCHKVKTASDKKTAAKIERIRARLEGRRRPRKRIAHPGWVSGKRTWPKRPFPK